MDILKKLINNPGLQHVAEIVIEYLDEDFDTLARKIAEDHEYRELFTKGEQDFLVKILRKSMYVEAKKICEEKRVFYDNQADQYENYKSIFDMFPFFAEALEELKSSESLLTFKQLQKTLSLLEYVITEDFLDYGKGVKLACLHKFGLDERLYETDEQGVKKGPKDMIKVLENGKYAVWDVYWPESQYHHDWSSFFAERRRRDMEKCQKTIFTK